MAGGKGKIDEYNKSITANERKANAKKAGESSGKSRRQMKLAKDIMTELLNASVEEGVAEDIDSIKSIKDIEGKNVTALAKGLASLATGVAEGDRKDIELALRIAGQWVEKSETTNIDATSEQYEDYVREKRDSGEPAI